MAWLYIVIADFFEVAWPFALKWSGSRPIWVAVLIAVAASVPILLLLREALKELPVATTYASFVGIATLGTAVAGIVWSGESASPARIVSFALVIVGVIGLRLFSD